MEKRDCEDEIRNGKEKRKMGKLKEEFWWRKGDEIDGRNEDGNRIFRGKERLNERF